MSSASILHKQEGKNEARVDVSIPVEYVQSQQYREFPLPFLYMNPANQRVVQYLFLRIADS